MRFQIYSDDILIGESDLLLLDPSMGIAGGPFVPAMHYQSVQPIFRLHTEGVWAHLAQRHKVFEQYHRERDALKLSVRNQSGIVIPVQCVHIDDCLSELGEIEVTVDLSPVN